MGRQKLDKEIFKKRILDSIKENESLSPAEIQERARISWKELNLILNDLVKEGILLKEPVKIKRFKFKKIVSNTINPQSLGEVNNG